jgi:threonyl-tRNA synthetase
MDTPDEKERDHKKLGRELDLYYIDEEVGKGLPMWTPKGTKVKFELEKFTRELEEKYGYDHVVTPYLGSEKLYETSGHLAHYKKNMYAPIDMDGDVFYLRPMACPHHIRLLLRKPLSYRDFPVRYAEVADYNRYEKSGELMGMIRVRKFQLTDGHIFVRTDQLKDEFKRVCEMIIEGMKGLGLIDIVTYRFSKRDPNNKEKYYPDDALWDKAESTMKAALDDLGIAYSEATDEAAFYGPKLDVQAKNVNGKEDTLFTAQMDFLLPEKFDITYTDADNTPQRPVMIHRSTIGSMERVFAFLIEHYGGAFPTWLAPVQARVLPVSEKHSAYAEEIRTLLKSAGIRADVDAANESLGKKIRNGKTEKIPYLIVVGDKEIETKTITVESRDHGKLDARSPSEFTATILDEIKNRTS